MIELVIEERRRNIGAFEVERVLHLAKRRMVGPFIFLDQMGPGWLFGAVIAALVDWRLLRLHSAKA